MEGTGKSIAVAYVLDEKAHQQRNAKCVNYWPAYIEEILSHLMVKGEKLEPEALEDEDNLSHFSAIVIADGIFSPKAIDNLQDWVEQGGILIGSACKGLDDLFGNKAVSVLDQPENDFTPAAYLSFAEDVITEGIHSPWHPDQKLLVFSDALLVEPEASEEVAMLYDLSGNDMKKPAVTKRQLGDGWAFYFAFDLPKTVWVIQQGRPVDKDYDGDGMMRTGDAIVVGRQDNKEVLYTYELVLLLQNMLALRPQPFVHSMPPTGGEITDVLFFYGGDDECDPGNQIPASEFMRSRGLPYHENIMPRKNAQGEWKFALSKEDFKKIQANGHECSLHYNFHDQIHPHAISRSEVMEQMDAYMEMYGERPICTVNHCCFWTGWYEMPKWLMEAGGQSDNCRVHHPSPPGNPVNLIGFSFGTSLPYHIYTDWSEGNEPLDFLILPITFYEVGYTGEKTDFDLLHKAVDIAAYYHVPADFFFHPVYIARYENCGKAIDELLRYLEEKKLVARHMGCDEMTLWWKDRLQAEVRDVIEGEDGIRFSVNSTYSDGSIIKLPLGDHSVAEATCDGGDMLSEERNMFGQQWLYMVVPQGKHEVEIKW